MRISVMRLLRLQSAGGAPPSGEALPQTSAPQTSASLPAARPEVAPSERVQDSRLEPTPEQTRYAGILEGGTYLGLLCLLITFPLYVLGVVEPHVPLQKVVQCWTLDAHGYRTETGTDAGWSWVSMVGHSDFMNFVGIAVLASVSVFCYCAVMPMMLKRKDWTYVVLALLQVAVLIVAASGIFGAGH
jgi:hypothetical protein